MVAATALALLLLAACLWLVLRAFAALRATRARSTGLIDLINRELPQTQCGRCGYAGCLPYARAIAVGEAINQCPPGGEQTIFRLARLLNAQPLALNPAHGAVQTAQVAFIREAECIGCTKCIQACPVDAILGGPRLMHTVIASECTGCDLCIEPCPVDCIDLLPLPAHTPARLPADLASPLRGPEQAWS